MDAFTCQFCAKRFTRKDALKRHGDCRPTEELCALCGGVFMSKMTFQRHMMLKHRGIKRGGENIQSNPMTKQRKLNSSLTSRGPITPIVRSKSPSSHVTAGPSTRRCNNCELEVLTCQWAAHIRTRQHMSRSGVMQEPGVELLKTSFRNRIATYWLNSSHESSNVKKFVEYFEEKFINLISAKLERLEILKVGVELFGRFLLATQKIEDIKSFNTKFQMVSQHTDLKELYNQFIVIIDRKVSEFYEKDSGWALQKLIHLDISINKVSPLHASSYITLPREIEAKKTILNIQNTDQKCFMWSILAAIHQVHWTHNANRVTNYLQYEGELNFVNLEFPIKLRDIGNLLVILVVTLSRRLRSITNFFLANLAVADFSVAVFCVYQNLLIYIVESWVLGDFLCKMYMFIQSLSSTASIFILVVICTERYFAILYPITCKQILTSIRLKMIICGVWSICILYSSPKFYWGNTVTIGNETVCVLNRQLYNSKWFDMFHFVLFYVVPLGVMSLLYTRIAVCLWNSSQQLKKQLDASSNSSQYQSLCRKQSSRQRNDRPFSSNGMTPCGTPISSSSKLQLQIRTSGSSYQMSTGSSPSCSENVLRARKGVIRMLIIVVVAFAVCNLPFHARKMWQYWSSNYHGNSNFSAIFTPLTFLCTYFNSGVNPLLYAFLSKNFRRGMREILFCSLKRKKRNSSLHHRMSTRSPRGVFHRHSSTRSTFKGNNVTTVTVVHECSSDEV